MVLLLVKRYQDNSVGLVMTVMPSWRHCARRASRSKMFVWARYSTGRTPRAADSDKIASAGDGFCRPAANHVSLSAIQKSGSACVIIASVSVITIPFSIVNFRPCWVRYSVIAVASSGVFDSAPGVGASKSRSWNIGVKVGIDVSKLSLMSSISKSFGGGNPFRFCCDGVEFAAVFDVTGCAEIGPELNVDCCMRPILLRARIYGTRISLGKFGGNSLPVFSDSCAFSGVRVVVCGFGSSRGVGCKNFGICILNSGARLRTMMVVVAMYIGIAASIKIPNTNPGKPRNLE